MPFGVLITAIATSNWPNLLLILLSTSLCIIAYLALVLITEEEKNQLRPEG